MAKVVVHPAWIKTQDNVFGIAISESAARDAALEMSAGNADKPTQMLVMKDEQTDNIISIFYNNVEYVKKG